MYRITISKVDSEGTESWFSFECNRELDDADGRTLAWLASLNFRISITNLKYKPAKVSRS